MRRIALVLGLLIAVGGLATASPLGAVMYDTDHRRYKPGQEVVAIVANEGETTWKIEGDWTIERAHSGDTVANYVFTPEEMTMKPGEKIDWHWDQHTRCYGACQNVWEGEPVGPGNYVAVLPTSMGVLKQKLEIGQFFTLGFRSQPDDLFTVFVRRADDIDQMRAEAEAEDKTLIVSGVVRKGSKYNPEWSYTMGPGSIVLGEVFIEVCDQNPHQVEENRKVWMGERWCPWSSYVERIGR